MKLIGITAQRQNGKDSLADNIIKIYGENWLKESFANPVKKTFCEGFDFDETKLEEWKVKDLCPPGMVKTVREALMYIGDGYRDIMPMIWVNKMANRLDHNKNYIIPDVRYVNELKFIKENGGVVILIWRKGWENSINHNSEKTIYPAVVWCKNCGEEGELLVHNWKLSDSTWHNAPPEIKYIDIFVRNDSDLDRLYEKSVKVAKLLGDIN